MKHVAILLITFYQQYLSMFVMLMVGQNRLCLQTPSCSEYTKQSILKKGIIQGCFLGVKRIASCRPKLKYV